MTTIPTRTEAIDRLVELDVARWGESEREPARRLRSVLSHALALNMLAYYDLDAIDEQLAADADEIMTDADRRELRSGG